MYPSEHRNAPYLYSRSDLIAQANEILRKDRLAKRRQDVSQGNRQRDS